MRRVLAPAGARAMDGHELGDRAIDGAADRTDELSTCSSAGEMRSSSATAPSAARLGSNRATCLISESASWSRVMAGCDFHPKACLEAPGVATSFRHATFAILAAATA